MAKAPAFQFYAADFLTDTAEMTDQEVGVYIRLLSHQWVNGSIHSDPNRLCSIAISLLDVWQELSSKFVLGEDGRLRNARMESERQKQAEYREKRRAAGSKGGKAKSDNAKTSSKDGSKTPSKPVAKAYPSSSSSSSSLTSTSTSTSSTKESTPLSGTPDYRIPIDYLNKKMGSNSHHVDSNLKYIKARLNEGHSMETMLAVIDCKVDEWKHDPKFSKYLRPSTLFNAEKFNQYAGLLTVKDSTQRAIDEFIKGPESSNIIEGEFTRGQ